ncbi:MAG: hypothetical protein R3B13_22450 [Polyangiaceae bacterium]
MSSDPAPAPKPGLWESEVIVSDVVGRLMEFWGFKRNMGRIWAVLYLSPEALTAKDLQRMLKLSSGAVSMTLNELLRWGVVQKKWVPGSRRDHFAAEVQLWKMISRVLSERELMEIEAAVEACEQALQSLEKPLSSGSDEVKRRARLQQQRISALLGLARLGHKLLRTLLTTAKVDADQLSRVELSR